MNQSDDELKLELEGRKSTGLTLALSFCTGNQSELSSVDFAGSLWLSSPQGSLSESRHGAKYSQNNKTCLAGYAWP
jgi:hypothetical protein